MASIDLIEGCTYREFSSLKADLIPYILEKQNAKDSYGMFFLMFISLLNVLNHIRRLTSIFC